MRERWAKIVERWAWLMAQADHYQDLVLLLMILVSLGTSMFILWRH